MIIYYLSIKKSYCFQDEEYGQQLVKALQYADFFIRNNHPNIKSLKKQIQRFFDLIFNAKIVTPTRDEFAMFIAQSSALRSACLSRQIGAAILNEDGEIVSTGCNDVPIEGIAPRQYLNLFRLYKERKKDGKMITQEAMEALPVIPEYLDTFVDYESQVTEHLKSLGFIN